MAQGFLCGEFDTRSRAALTDTLLVRTADGSAYVRGDGRIRQQRMDDMKIFGVGEGSSPSAPDRTRKRHLPLRRRITIP